MSDEQIRKIIEDSYDESREEGVFAMTRLFYSRRMRTFAALMWIFSSLCVAVAVYGAILFFQTEQTQGQILYATLFIGGAYGLGVLKIIAFDMLNGYTIRRDIKRLELRVAELREALKAR